MENNWLIPHQTTKEDPFAHSEKILNLFGTTPGLTSNWSAHISLKAKQVDVFGGEFDVIYSNASPKDSEVFNAYDQTRLKRWQQLNEFSPETIEDFLGQSRIHIQDPLPSFDIMYHMCLPGAVVVFCAPLNLMGLDLCEGASERFKALFKDELIWLDEFPGITLAKKLAKLDYSANAQAVLVHQYGVFVFGPDPDTVTNRLAALVQKAEESCARPTAIISNENYTIPEDSSDFDIEEITSLRKQLSQAAGTPLLVRTLMNVQIQQLLGQSKTAEYLASGPILYQQTGLFHNGFLTADSIPESLPHNNILLHPKFGLMVTAQSIQALNTNCHFACDLVTLGVTAFQNGNVCPALLEIERQAVFLHNIPHDKSSMFIGEVALVTGAASGIGRGCVLSLLERGAMVIGVDINPAITEISEAPSYLGIQCDLCDEGTIGCAFDQILYEFGGLDMVVLNAGIFTKSAMIKELEISLWQQVMRVNLDANICILRSAYPFLKAAPSNGRVVVNGSRNVPAPGPGAAAYSTSKAGLTQLARVAALEWGQDGIRVNIIHPHAVFDTGIWTDEVLQSRAAKYGISVQEYKTNNLLKVELTSHDIGELVCEMMGPSFSKTTGAQVPVDGGCDRVI